MNPAPEEYEAFAATWDGDLGRIKDAIEQEGFDVNHQYHYRGGSFSPPATFHLDAWMIHTGDLHGSTMLHIACFRGHLPTVEFLLSQGAQSTLWNAFGRTPQDMSGTRLATCSNRVRQSIDR